MVRFGAALRRFFRSPRTVLLILLFHLLYATAALGTDRLTFSSPLFLTAVAMLFISTAVCTIERTALNVRLVRGAVRRCGTPLPRRRGRDVRAYLRSIGFRGEGAVMFRHRHALWGGWIFHVGLLLLIFGVLVQRSMHDSGGFELTEGERVRLAEAQIVGRDRGAFAPRAAPDLEVALLAFDPFYHQHGYAPDRASRLVAGGREVFVDRAAGVSVRGVTIYQAIPTSLAINLAGPSIGLRSIHLRRESDRVASADVTDPAGNCMRFVVKCERPINDPAGTGRLEAYVDTRGGRTPLDIGARFPFGGEMAEVLSISRWAGFTYSRSPGVPFVFAGFVIILLGSLLLSIPYGIAQISDDGDIAAWIHGRYVPVIAAEWCAGGEGEPAAAGDLIPIPLLTGSGHA